jgi:hypothetical protein
LQAIQLIRAIFLAGWFYQPESPYSFSGKPVVFSDSLPNSYMVEWAIFTANWMAPPMDYFSKHFTTALTQSFNYRLSAGNIQCV